MKKNILTIIIFLVVFVVIYAFATGGFARLGAKFSPQEPAPPTNNELMEQLLARNYGISPFWLARYNASVETAEDVLEDADEDGLTLKQEYEYLTNPFNPDTDGDGQRDGDEVFKGMSPTGEGVLDSDNNGLPDTWEKEHGITGGDNADQEDSDGDGLPNIEELKYGTDPLQKDSDADGYDDATEINHGYDPVAPGDARPDVRIVIDRINVDVPVILSRSADEKELQKDLEHGVIHYPDMAMPGQRGNIYIAGHSSNYAWSQGSFNNIFKDLVKLSAGDEIDIIVTYNNGKSLTYKYIVEENREVSADDPAIFEQTLSQTLTLTTCWPLGTANRRIMIKARPA